MMHRLRQLAPALVALFLFQLIVLGAGFGCAVPAFAAAAVADVVPGADVRAASGGHAHHGTDASTSVDLAAERGEPTTSHEPHGGLGHCSSAMACATAVVARAPALVPDAGMLAASTTTSLDPTAPASVFGAPETPPPRA